MQFNNGDKVVYETGINYLLEVRINHQTKSITVRRSRSGNNYARFIKPLSSIRKATDSEEKAGIRL